MLRRLESNASRVMQVIIFCKQRVLIRRTRPQICRVHNRSEMTQKLIKDANLESILMMRMLNLVVAAKRRSLLFFSSPSLHF